MGQELVLEPVPELELGFELELELKVLVHFWMTLAFGPVLSYRFLDTALDLGLPDLVGKWEDRVLRDKPPVNTRCERVLLRFPLKENISKCTYPPS